MTQELLYTSAPRGLKPGSSGFCTVASTRGMAAPLASALESLSAYRHVFRPGDPQVHRNPVTHSHVRLNAGGRTYSVLSRIADYGQDYSGRTNKLAHHVALAASETTSAGPAWLLGQPEFMQTTWDGEPRILPAGRGVGQGGQPAAGVCRHWRDMTGDAGWAGVLAESFLRDPQRPVYVIFEPGMDLLPLFVEAIGLLPDERRWEVTFSTYFTSLPRGVTCNWRAVLAGSEEANHSRRFVHALRLDLTQPMDRAAGGALVEQARSGRQVPVPSAAPAPGGSGGADAASGSDEYVPDSGGDSSAYPLSASPAAPPPPPRARSRRGKRRTSATSQPGRRKLALATAAAFVLLGLIAGGTYIVQSGGGKDGKNAAPGKQVAAVDKAADGQSAGGQPEDAPATTSPKKPLALHGHERGTPDAADNGTKSEAPEATDTDSSEDMSGDKARNSVAAPDPTKSGSSPKDEISEDNASPSPPTQPNKPPKKPSQSQVVEKDSEFIEIPITGEPES